MVIHITGDDADQMPTDDLFALLVASMLDQHIRSP
jgi:hypothetical protein